MREIPKDKRIVGGATDEALRGVYMAFEPMRYEIYKKVAPIVRWLDNAVTYCTLYMDKRKMGRRRKGM